MAGESLIGRVFDERYRILRKLGEGSMGEVYLAEHVTLGRQDALKVLRAQLSTDPAFVARFRREARATNRLHHPNIVAIHDFGRLDKRYYLAMELITGERLDALLGRLGPLPLPRVLGILTQLADAVDHAHTEGVVHRDLKPDNLLLVEHRGRPDVLKVLDFGVAKIVRGDVPESISVSHSGQIWGTPAYMAPELFGGQADPRADLYAIGCVAFKLLTGETPFAGNLMEQMQQHLQEAPERPSARRPSARVPPDLDELVLRCLAKRGEERYQTGRDLKLALERLSPSVPRGSTRRPTGTQRAVGDTLAAGDAAYSRTDDVRDASGPIAMVLIERAAHELTRSLAQALSELDANAGGLFAALVRLRQLDDDLAWLDAQQGALDQLQAELEEGLRAREASLRFALGELHYERGQALRAGATPAASIDAEIQALEARVAELADGLERDLTPVTDLAIALAARRDGLLEHAAELYARLDPEIDALSPRWADHPTIAPLLVRQTAIAAARRR